MMPGSVDLSSNERGSNPGQSPTPMCSLALDETLQKPSRDLSKTLHSQQPDASTNATELSKTLHSATKHSEIQVNRENAGTKPKSLPRKLTPRQLLAVRILTVGVSIESAAKHLRISRQTLSTWKRWPEFQAELSRMHLVAMQNMARK